MILNVDSNRKEFMSLIAAEDMFRDVVEMLRQMNFGESIWIVALGIVL